MTSARASIPFHFVQCSNSFNPFCVVCRRNALVHTMKRALLSIAVILAVAASLFVEQGDAIFRASRETIKKLQREVPVRNGSPFCYNAGKALHANVSDQFWDFHLGLSRFFVF